MATSFTPAQTGLFRVFTIEDQAGPSHEPEYQSSMMSSGIDVPFGDSEAIKSPDPGRYNEFVEVGSVRGAADRASTSLVGRYALDLASTLLALGKKGCPLDVQLHGGECTNPAIFNDFVKAIVYEDVRIGSWSTDELGALSDDERAEINETGDITVGLVYEILQLTTAASGADVVQNIIVDGVIYDVPSCGECDIASDGCERIYMLQGLLTGSPGTAPDVIYTNDGATNWASDEITTMTSAETADAIAGLAGNIVVISGDSDSLHYKDQDDVDDGTAGGWTEVATGFVGAGSPRDIWSLEYAAFIVGDGGYVYYCTNPADGVTVLDAGVTTSENLVAVHALDENHAVAVGENDTIIYTETQGNWNTATATGNGGTLNAVWMVTEKVWWVVSDDGHVYYTEDQGDTWTEKTLPGTVTQLHDIAFSTGAVGYVVGDAAGAGVAWRTYNGGYTWVAMPEGVGNLPTSVDLRCVVACTYDPNFAVFGGAGAANDGVLIVAED